MISQIIEVRLCYNLDSFKIVAIVKFLRTAQFCHPEATWPWNQVNGPRSRGICLIYLMITLLKEIPPLATHRIPRLGRDDSRCFVSLNRSGEFSFWFPRKIEYKCTMDLKKALKTTERYIAILNSWGIFSMKDFLNYFPRTHEDRQTIMNISDAQSVWWLLAQENTKTSSNGKISLRAVVTEKKVMVLRTKKKIYEIKFEDENGQKGKASFFGTGFTFQNIEKGQRYIIIWKPKFIKNTITFWHPEFIKSSEPEVLHSNWDWDNWIQDFGDIKSSLELATQINEDTFNMWRLYPVYPEMLWVKSWWFAKKMREALLYIEWEYLEYLPEDFRNHFQLPDIATTIKNLHYPKDADDLREAKYRLYFDRLLKIQLQSIIARKEYERTSSIESSAWATKEEIDRSIIKEMMDSLPFQLTDAQKKVIKQTIENFYSGKPMLRLVQWDVGSGKTIVAAICAFYIIRKLKWQVALLVPIEVLAIQHYASFVKLFHPLGIHVRLLTGSVTASNKQKIKQELKAGLIDIVIGTHAIIQDDVEFRNLQFVVIDEQHKFGVKQRSFFKKFGAPHILQMTATPIPRTLALAYFAEFDVSIIDQMPAGRKPIITKVVTKKERKKLKGWIIDRITKGQSVFVVVPLIEESEQLDGVHSALTVHQEYVDDFSAYYKSSEIGLMHGRLSSKEKEEVMRRFKQWDSKILVSTTVIEVGVDVPQATIMIIKNAERFWLSQLHQLRGRVGRSDLQSYCFLETKSLSGNERLKAMEDHTDGFKLAEIDMQLRGTGEIMGYRQSWESDIPTEVLMDIKFIEKIQDAAHWLFERYPGLRGLKLLESEIDYVEWELMS